MRISELIEELKSISDRLGDPIVYLIKEVDAISEDPDTGESVIDRKTITTPIDPSNLIVPNGRYCAVIGAASPEYLSKIHNPNFK